MYLYDEWVFEGCGSEDFFFLTFIDEMNGIFGFAIYDVEKDAYFVARDHMGIIPLYIGWDVNGTFYVASELKALEGVCTKNRIVSSWALFV